MLKGKSLTKLTNQKGIINQEKEGKKNEYLTKYREVEILGKGTQGTAHLVKSKVDLKFYVAKKIPLTILDEKKRTTFEQEFEILKQLHHPHIVSYVECFREESQMIVLIEYFEQGDLLFHLKLKIQEKEQLSEIVVMNWFSQLTMALDFIHEKGILHQNIKPSNIFLTKSGSIKLGDFGISSLLLSSKDKTATNSYSEKSDIWALGCILFEMCSLKVNL